jgi:hypothetical protein
MPDIQIKKEDALYQKVYAPLCEEAYLPESFGYLDMFEARLQDEALNMDVWLAQQDMSLDEGKNLDVLAHLLCKEDGPLEGRHKAMALHVLRARYAAYQIKQDADLVREAKLKVLSDAELEALIADLGKPCHASMQDSDMLLCAWKEQAQRQNA